MVERFLTLPKARKTSIGAIQRVLIHKKFVNIFGLIASLTPSFLYLVFSHYVLLRYCQIYLIIVTDIPVMIIIWHRAYQIFYDIKLIFCFSKEYDIKLTKIDHSPPITFIIPSCQEPFNVAKMTFDSVINLPYTGIKEIIVVDNSKDIEKKDFKDLKNYVESFNGFFSGKNLITKFLYNYDRETLKPGNLDLAQRHLGDSKYVFFLDVDSSLPERGDLLKKAISEFESDNSLAFIQFRIKATNDGFNNLTQCISSSQNLLRLRMISRGYGGYKIFEGHNGIWRKSVLDEIGPWTQYYKNSIMITEDILKSADAYAKGYYGKSLNIITGEWVPTSLKSLENMWMRWMYGNSQVVFKCFNKIYSRKTTLLEKFDITHHIGHHVVTLFLFLVSILLQLLVKGQTTNLFIILFGIIPQIIGGVTSYFSSEKEHKIPLWKKIRNIYCGFFIIENFIMFIQIKSDLKFMLGLSQGWKVTNKGEEGKQRWYYFFRQNLFYIGMAVLSLTICCISWKINYSLKVEGIQYHLGSLFGTISLVLCLIFFRKAGGQG